jgi:hypothetical protein
MLPGEADGCARLKAATYAVEERADQRELRTSPTATTNDSRGREHGTCI